MDVPALLLPGDGPDVISGQTRAAVFAAVLSAGPLSRVEVAERTGLSPSTVTKVVAPLMEAGYLVETGVASAGGTPGRPRRMLSVNRDRHRVAGVKLHPSKVTAVLTDMEGRVTARAERRLRGHRPESVLRTAADAVAELMVTEGPPALGLGVGVGGHVDQTTGKIVHSGILGWEDVDVAGPLAELTGLPTVVSNDVNTLVVAEHWFGKGRGTESFAVVTVGAGIGCGLLLGGRLYTGAGGLAGELGHLPLYQDGPECSCGNRGCLEAMASTPAILRSIAERGGPALRSIVRAARLAREDSGPSGAAARAAFEAAGEALGRGLAALYNLLNLEMVILSGEDVNAHDLFGPAASAAAEAHAFSTAARDCELVVDAVDDQLWARGAACLVIHQAVGITPR
ncbi:ROK family transcriptional regulator [Microtetraspora sp. NBRC 16547]|uniref:ROK family transcriptional regulator n=1 Tax=Microtetraspora sp. NBRC 16547 TaxID=3030993 RepID=UPI0024A4FE42|nr:ROK family transcriptional regulator [Microtetraspora sp. NBRC 16547]GLW96771.1 sugar kinase [Microtetraspora sp. NBRC 16547]